MTSTELQDVPASVLALLLVLHQALVMIRGQVPRPSSASVHPPGQLLLPNPAMSQSGVRPPRLVQVRIQVQISTQALSHGALPK